MRRIFFTLLLGIATLLPALAGPRSLPPAFTAVYTVKKAGLTLGDVKISLRYDNDRYRYHKETRSRGLLALFRRDVINETSEGRVEDGRLTMDRYRYVRDDGKRRLRNTIRLLEGDRIVERYKEKDYDYQVPANTLDRASVEIALMRDAGLDRERFGYDIAERGRSKRLEFQRVGKRRVDTPAGRFDCVEYRVERHSRKRSTSLCLAPELNYLPVTITHVEKGTSFTMFLKAYHPIDG